MDSPLTFRGRLPGVVCETALPAPIENPLRLDIAAFVGFAERGPLDTPVMVEDISQYQVVFGGDLLVAHEGGQPVYACLPGAVRAFFNNGGRRCYVVRVAGANARANHFRLPGLTAFSDWNSLPELSSIDAKAAWVGRWSDNMSVGTQLLSQPLRVAATSPDFLEIDMELPSAKTVLAGDLLRLRCSGLEGREVVIYFPVSETVSGAQTLTNNSKQIGLSARARGVPVKVLAKDKTLVAFNTSITSPFSLLAETATVERLSGTNWQILSYAEASLELLQSGFYSLHLLVADPTQVKAGDSVRIRTASETLLSMNVNRVRQIGDSGGALLLVEANPANLIISPTLTAKLLPLPLSVERLAAQGWQNLTTTELMGKDFQPLKILADGELALFLPTSTEVTVGDLLRVTCAGNNVLIFPVERITQDQTVDLSGLLMLTSRKALWQQETGTSTTTWGQLEQADLLTFNLYIREGDKQLETWTDLRFGSDQAGFWAEYLTPALDLAQTQITPGGAKLDLGRSLRLGVPQIVNDPSPHLYLPLGMNELTGVDEYTRPVIDHDTTGKDGLDVFDPVQLFLDPQLSLTGARDLVNEASQRLYLSDKPVPLQKLHSLIAIEDISIIAIPDAAQRGWPSQLIPPTIPLPPPPPPTPCVPDWACFQNCATPVVVQVQPSRLPERAPCEQPEDVGTGTVGTTILDIRQELQLLPVQNSPLEYDVEPLLQVQRALINFCSGRADLVTTLSVPQHFNTRQVLDWQHKLVGTPAFNDGTALSYAAAYHPWLLAREEESPELAPLRASPPDGTVCGMIAAREQIRGAWIAPANQPLFGVLGLSPELTNDDCVSLFNAHINIIRQQPGQFTTLSAHTLCQDQLWLQLSVRRLIIFLRKLALRRGMRYVFETNNERFRRLVQTSFERTLRVMMDLGAVNAFQVVTDSSINTQNDYDNGRFLIALKVSPTLPIEFITVVLLRSGESLLEILER